jgi:hypothetical protein
MNVLIKAHTYVCVCVLVHHSRRCLALKTVHTRSQRLIYCVPVCVCVCVNHSQHWLAVVEVSGADLRPAQHERAQDGS